MRFIQLAQGSESCQSMVVELDNHSSPRTFASVTMLKLWPWQERSVLLPISEGNNIGCYYGHKRIAKASSAFITNMFGCPEESFLSQVFLQPPLPYFIASIIHRAHIPYAIVSAAHVLLQRYQSQIPHWFDSSKLRAHRLFLASIIYAVREHWPEHEKVFNNDIWSRVSNFTASDIGMMLDDFYDKLDGKIGVSSTVFGTLKNKVSSIFNRKKQRSLDSRFSDESC